MRRLLPRRSRSAGWNGWDTSHACLVKGYQSLHCLVGCPRNAPETPQVQSKKKMKGCDQEGLEGYRSEGG